METEESEIILIKLLSEIAEGTLYEIVEGCVFINAETEF